MLLRKIAFIGICFLKFFISPANADETITLQLKWVNQFQFAGYYAALEKGYYKDAGLDVIIKPNGYNDSFISPVEAVIRGDAQYGISNSGLVLDYLNGKPVVAVAATLQHSAVAWIVLEKSGFRSIHDLAKQRLMTVFPLSESLELLEPFRAEGIPPRQLHLVQTGFDLTPLINGEVAAYDGYVTNEPFLLQQQGIPYRIIDPRNYGIDFYGDVLFTSQTEAKQHPARVAAFKKASMLGWQYAMTHPEEIIDLILKKYAPQKSREHLRFEASAMQDLMQTDIIEIGHMNPGRWKYIAEIMTEHNRLIDAHTLDDFLFDNADLKIDLTYYVRIISAISVVGLFFSGIIAWVYRINKTLKTEILARKEAEQQLRMLSETDPLTGIANRRAFQQHLEQEFFRFKRYRRPYSVMMIDLDWFKQVNDSLGHQAGDYVLQEFANRISMNLRKSDLLARMGGEEFAILMPETAQAEATTSAQHILTRINERPFLAQATESNPVMLTASIGVASSTFSDETPDAPLNRADRALYEAKKSGRNQVIFGQDQSPALSLVQKTEQA